MKRLLKYLYRNWLKVAKTISYIITLILLVSMYYSIFSIYGLLLRLLKTDLCDLEIDRDKDSYFGKIEIKPVKKEEYSQQF